MPRYRIVSDKKISKKGCDLYLLLSYRCVCVCVCVCVGGGEGRGTTGANVKHRKFTGDGIIMETSKKYEFRDQLAGYLKICLSCKTKSEICHVRKRLSYLLFLYNTSLTTTSLNTLSKQNSIATCSLSFSSGSHIGIKLCS